MHTSQDLRGMRGGNSERRWQPGPQRLRETYGMSFNGGRFQENAGTMVIQLTPPHTPLPGPAVSREGRETPSFDKDKRSKIQRLQ